MKSVRPIAITWFDHRRTAELCAGLGIELFTIATSRRGLVRYLELAYRTIGVVARVRPKSLLVQNPSLVLAAFMVLMRPIFGYRLVVDAHNEAVEPYINRSGSVRYITHWVLRRADLTIVTNPYLARVVDSFKGNPYVLPDRVPCPPAFERKKLPAKYPLLLISTFAPDEPLAAVIDAVRNTHYTLYVTGNSKKAPANLLANSPVNVIFTGYLSESEYWQYLDACDAIIDLTMMSNCLVCGGYEAAALGKPLLLTRSPAAVDLFGDAAMFTDNTPEDIRRTLARLCESEADLRDKMRQRQVELSQEWRSRAERLSLLLQVPDAGSTT